MVVADAPGEVVVVEPVVGVVVLVVVLVDVEVVDDVDDVEDVEVTEVDVVGDDVVVLGAGDGDGDGVKMSFTEVPVPPLPKMADSGLPEISSTAVMNRSASTNTIAAVPAMAVQVNRRGPPRRSGGTGVVVARRFSVTGASATAVMSRSSRRSAGPALDSISTVSAFDPTASTASVGLEAASTDDAASPLALVAPSRRRSGDESGARTATCLTACWPRSIDCATSAVPMVAAADPMATPMMVPLTPKLDAMSAAITAPAAEARIWRKENFTPLRSDRAPGRRPCSLPHRSVDLLTQQVGVPVVAGVLLNHVHHDPPQGEARLLGGSRRDVEALGSGNDRS